MLCSFALYSQCWEVVVYQEMICILALGQKYGTCNYARERQNLLTRKTKAIKVSGCVLIKLLCAWAFCLKLYREFSGKIKKQEHTILNLQHSFAKVQKLWVTSMFPLPDWPAWGFSSWEGRKLHVHPWYAQARLNSVMLLRCTWTAIQTGCLTHVTPPPPGPGLSASVIQHPSFSSSPQQPQMHFSKGELHL